jgi:hypothetical protein
VRAARTSLPEPYSGKGRVALFVSAGNPERHRLGATLGWDRLLDGNLMPGDLPGDHYSLLRDPGVQGLAEHLRERLAGA